MLRRRLALAPLYVGLLITTCAAARAEPRALVELFTSQGCSSCPPADTLLGELAADPSVVAISVPIDYWDYLGWKDTLSLPGHSQRQRAYARLRGDREVYTPQIVVDGSVHVLGSDRAAVKRAITQTAARNAAIMSLPVLVSVESGTLTVKIKASDKTRDSGEVWLCPLSRSVSVAIAHGENDGRTINYSNVVRGWRKLGAYTDADGQWDIPLADFKAEGIDAAAVMVQEGSHDKPGIILGAAYTALPDSHGLVTGVAH
jgi:hypothetical protein